jgi:hypothetical protein
MCSLQMEFANRDKCIEHYQQQFQNLPRYMIEMALDYDLQGGGSSNEKPITGSQKRKTKRLKAQQAKEHAARDTSVTDAVKAGKAVELDNARVIPQAEFEPAPFMPGYISLDGMEVLNSHAAQESSSN